MPALKTLGLVILAAFVVSLGILGYIYARALVNERDARDAAIKVDATIQTAINTGNPQTVSVSVPGDYIMMFVDNRVVIDGFATPEQGLAMQFAENCPKLGAGDHFLTITLENYKVVVENSKVVVQRM